MISSERAKELWKDPEFRKKQKAGMNRKDVKKKLSIFAKQRMQDPEIKSKMIRTMKKKFSDPDFRKMISERTKQGLKEKGSMVIVPSSALDSMNLGAIGGLASLSKTTEG